MTTEVKAKDRLLSLSELNRDDTLLIAIGNSARSDDGLGWAFLEQLKDLKTFKGQTNSCYQLQIEDAEYISHYPCVIFVDATEENLQGGYEFVRTAALNDFTFTTHALSPEAVLFLCNNLYQKSPEAYTLKIMGKQWELKTGLSEEARKNLNGALIYFNEILALSKINESIS